MSDPTTNPPVVPDHELLRKIGGGGYGDVWLARGVTGSYRAVKIVRRDNFKDERPFLRELEGITRYQQMVAPGIPSRSPLLHVGERPDQGWFHFVMELADDAVNGTELVPSTYVPLTLKELKARRVRLPASECLRLALGLARGVGVLHDLGLLHRDIKPSNIILVHGMPKLADLGLVSSSDRTLTSVGTPGYAPPEGPGSVRADLYSLGRVLYELATGLPSAASPRIPETLFDESADDRFLELNEVLLKAGAPDPEDRYPSAGTLLADLLFIEAGGSIKAVSAFRRYTVRAAWTASVVVGVGALVVLMLATRDRIILRTERAKTATARRTSIYVGDLAIAAPALRRFGVLGPGAGAPSRWGSDSSCSRTKPSATRSSSFAGRASE